MDLFSCNNCKRCRRRRTTSSGDETDRPTEVDGRHRHSTNLRRERITIINDCCAAAAMYFYAAPRRSGRGGRRQPEVVDTAPIDSLEMTASAGHTGCKRTSILKKSGDESPISVPVGRRQASQLQRSGRRDSRRRRRASSCRRQRAAQTLTGARLLLGCYDRLRCWSAAGEAGLRQDGVSSGVTVPTRVPAGQYRRGATC